MLTGMFIHRPENLSTIFLQTHRQDFDAAQNLIKSFVINMLWREQKTDNLTGNDES